MFFNPIGRSRWRRTVPAIGIVAVFAVLLAIGTRNYMLFHSFVELFSIVIGCAIFTIAWNTRRLVDNDFLLFIGIGLLFISIMDLVHMLAYRGMNIITNSTDPATQLWIQKQFIESVTLLVAPLFLTRRLRASYTFAIYGAITLACFLTVFYIPVFPQCYVDGHGLTAFKKTSEVVIVGLFGLAMIATMRRRDRFEPFVLGIIMGAYALLILSEASFMFYVSPTGFVNMGGHFLQVAAYGMIYQAFVVTGLRQPFNLLFTNFKRSQIELRRKHDELEMRVAERTVELNQSIVELEKRAEQLRNLSTQLIQAEQAERRRLSQLLHDHLQQMLVAARIHLGFISNKVADNGQEALTTAQELINDAINESRSLSAELSPRILYDSGLPSALEWLGKQMQEKHGLKIETRIEPVQPEDDNTSMMLFHSARELLFNVVKHAQSSEARIILEHDRENGIRLGIEDDGVGYDPQKVTENIGLASIRERMAYMGGRMDVDASPGKGTRVYLHAPVSRGASRHGSSDGALKKTAESPAKPAGGPDGTGLTNKNP